MRFFVPVVLFACTALIAVSPAQARSSDRASKISKSVSQNEKLLWDRAEGRSSAASSRPTVASNKKSRNARYSRKAGQSAKRHALVHKSPKSSLQSSKSRNHTASVSKAPAQASGLRAKVNYHAAKHGVPADVAHGVVMVESRYNSKATGPGGYIGLMQLSYRTAQGMGYKGTRAGLYDSDTNLHYGMKYLAGAWQKSGGNLCGAVSKYQGGHGVKGVTRAGAVYCSKVRRHIADLNRGSDLKLAAN